MKTEPTTDIIAALDLEGLTPEEQEEMLLDLGDLVYKGTMLRLIERMDDATRTDFEALLERDPEEGEITAFLEERIPDADTAAEETLAELRNDILAVTG